MNRKQRIRMIVRVLMMPFIHRDFLEDSDPLERKAVCYKELQKASFGDFSVIKQRYQGVERALIGKISALTHCDRLSELSQLAEMFYPEEALAECLSLSCKYPLDHYYLNKILQTAGEFITLRDGRVSIRMWEDPHKDSLLSGHSGLYKVEVWSELTRTITPDLFIAAYFVQSGIRDINYLYHLPSNIFLSDSLVDRYLSEGIAETHVHFSAGMSYLFIWEAVTDLTVLLRRLPNSNDVGLLAASYLRLLFAEYLEAGCGDFLEYVYESRANLFPAILAIQSGHLQNFYDYIKQQAGSLLPELYSKHGVSPVMGDSFDILLRGPFARYSKYRTSPELLMQYMVLDHLQVHPEHHELAHVFLQYLRLKSAYFSEKLQPAGISGLTHFRAYFGRATRALHIRDDAVAESVAYRSVFRSQFQSPYLKKLEIKISPPNRFNTLRTGTSPAKVEVLYGKTEIAIQLSVIFEAFLRVCGELCDDAHPGAPSLPTLGINYHFIKRDICHPPANACWVCDGDLAPSDYVVAVRRQCECFLQSLQELLLEVPYLSEYVVGIDAASEENYAEPWVYAPVYKKARNRYVSYPIQLITKNHIQNIGFTYHVGEDYRHVLSGLRHLDEVLTYFGYKAGDRLGHGLVLQVDLQEWLQNNEVVSMPVMENLENLLWLWHICGQSPLELKPYELKLEQRIMDVAGDIYGNTRGISPHVLWAAYTRKFQDLDEDFRLRMKKLYLESHSPQHSSFHGCWAQDGFCVLQPRCVIKNSQDLVWDADKLLLTHYCPVFIKLYQKPVFVQSLMDVLPVYQAVQRLVRDRVQNAGVFIETNPTSNMIIGDVNSLYNYPITALNDKPFTQPTKASVLLSVNSDNPLILTTNVENEISILYHILLNHGYSSEDVLNWIDKIRAYGMKSSFIRCVKDFKRQEFEISEILNRLTLLTGRPPLKRRET